MTERRTTRRYGLSLPVSMRFPVVNGSALHSGETRDISTRGVYFLLDNDLNTGTELDLTMTLPAELTGKIEVFIHAIGKVVRVERRGEDAGYRVGIAAVIERYEVVRNEAAIVS